MHTTYERIARQAGAWLVAKLRKQAAESGTYAAARNARKQGIPLALALLILRRSA